MSYAPEFLAKPTPKPAPAPTPEPAPAPKRFDSQYPTPTSTYNFKSLIELGRYLRNAAILSGESSTREDDKFFPMTYDQTLEILNKGGAWPEGAKALQQVTIPAFYVMRELDTMVLESMTQGFAPNVGAYLANLPDSMFSIEKQEQRRPVLRLEVGATVSCLVDPESVLNRGRAILSIIKVLEAKGVSVELTAYTSHFSKNGKRGMRASYMIKQASASLNVAALAFVLCNASFMRRASFRLLECCPTNHHLTGQSYGYSYSFPSVDADISITTMCKRENRACSTPEKAVNYVLEYIKPFIDKLS